MSSTAERVSYSPPNIGVILFILDFIFCQCQTTTIGNLSMLSFNSEERDLSFGGRDALVQTVKTWGCQWLHIVSAQHLPLASAPVMTRLFFLVTKMLPDSITLPPKMLLRRCGDPFWCSLYHMTWQSVETLPSAKMHISYKRGAIERGK